MSLEASQGAIRRRCSVCGRRIHGTNTSGLCQFHRAGKKVHRAGKKGGLCRSCPAVLTLANRSGYCTACHEQTDEQREARRIRERERYREQITNSATPCRHCRIRQVSRAKGLCFRCSRNPAIRNLYPTTSKYANKGVSADGEDDFEPQPCPEPTGAIPGTEAKLAVLEARAAARVELWHEDDLRFTSDTEGG